MNNGIKTANRREFLRLAGSATVASSFYCLIPNGWSAPSAGVPRARLARLAKGANVCRWFRFAKPESSEQFANYITEAEAKMMAQMGLTHVRLCLEPKFIMEQSTGAIHRDNAAAVDAAIERFHRAGLLVLVDLHNEDRASELSPVWQKAFLQFWADYAARLRHFDPEFTMFEVINEPVFHGREPEWNMLNGQVTAAIRKNAPLHTIMTSGPNWGGIDGLHKLKLLSDLNVVYSFHCYDPFAFSHQGATWAGPDVKPLRGVPYPSSPETVAPLLADLSRDPGSMQLLEKYGKENWNKAKLAARFKQGVEWGVHNNVPLYCGEFGVFPPYAKPEHRANWFRDFGQVLGANQIGWAVWGWDEGFGLNRRYVQGKPEIDRTVATSLGLNLV
jgi:aryl-phospho-beta-D-glucosidase BglC (GH1 family)